MRIRRNLDYRREKEMKIVDLLRKESINLNGEVHSKKETIDQMVDLMAAGGNIADVDAYREGVYKKRRRRHHGDWGRNRDPTRQDMMPSRRRD